MATSITAEALRERPQRPFPVRQPSDYKFFLTYVVLIWLAVLAGFIPDMIRHVRSQLPPYPISVHVHAVITAAWLVLLTGQTLLIRNREIRLHRKIGIAGAVLAVLVVLFGVWVPLSVESLRLDTPRARPPFLAIELSNIIEFAALAAAAIIARKQPSAHKRLILLATLSLTPAAFNRLIGRPLILPLLGSGVWQTWVQIFAATALMVLGIGIYDWWTRQRIHPAWAIGALWIVAGQLTASYLFYNPTWKTIATSILRAW
jgi:uncharacterized membrane protein YozB (DUF420 family)